MATYNRACRFGLDPGALDRADSEVLGVIQIESAIAVGDAEAIAALDGVDVLFVGPRDLSHDLGVPGDLTAPAFTEAIAHVLAARQRHGKACGLLVADGAAADAAGAGLVVRGHRLGFHPAGRRGDRRVGWARTAATPSGSAPRHERHRRRICPARHRPDQRGLDGQAAHPRLPGGPAGLPRTEDAAEAGARGRHRRRPGGLRPRGPRVRPGQHRLPRRARRSRRRRGVHLRAEHAAPRDRCRGAEPGKPFWIEKPVGRDAGEAAEVATAARRPRHHLDRLQLPARPRGERVRELIAAGRLGRVTNVRAVFFNSYASEPNGALSWRFRREEAGSGALGDLLSHVVDLMQYVVSPITEVSSLLSTVYAQRPILPMGSGTHFAVIENGEMGEVENDNYVAALVRFAGGAGAYTAGAVGTLEASRVSVGPQCSLGFEIYGTEGSAIWNFEQMNELRLCLGRGGPAHADHGYTTVLGNASRAITAGSAGARPQHELRRPQGHRGQEVPGRGRRRRAAQLDHRRGARGR